MPNQSQIEDHRLRLPRQFKGEHGSLDLHTAWTRCSSKVLLIFNSGGKLCWGTKNQFIDMLALMERT